MLHIALCCLEGSTMSNLVHQRRRCARIVHYMILLPGRQYAAGQIGLSLFIALARMVTLRMKVMVCFQFWALRASSYKTKAEV